MPTKKDKLIMAMTEVILDWAMENDADVQVSDDTCMDLSVMIYDKVIAKGGK